MNGHEKSPDSTNFGSSQLSDIYVLAEFNLFDDIQSSNKATNRVQYTCFDVSKRYIAFGANTGGVYIFHRDSFKYLQLLPNQDSSILLVAFSPDDNVLAVATSKGLVTVLEHNSDSGKNKISRQQVSPEHRLNQVTFLQWDLAATRLFIGDDIGKVSVMNITSSKAWNLFTFPYQVLMKLNARIVQLDYAENKLLVSTTNKCFVCFTDREKYVQVGKKPRDGDFGACFYYNSKNQTPIIYSARPGSRIWEADCNGEVLNTHQLRDLLAVAPSPLVTVRIDYQLPLEKIKYPPRTLNFSKLLFVGDHFLVMWMEHELFIIDPVNVNVLLWTNQIQDIMEIKCYKSVLYILSHQGTVRKLSLMPLGKCIAQLFNKKLWKLCAQVCWHHQNYIITPKLRRYIPYNMIENLKEKLFDEGFIELSDLTDILLNKLETDSGDPPSPISSDQSSISSYDSYRLDSGIVMVHPTPFGISNEEEFYGLNSEKYSHFRNFMPTSTTLHNTLQRNDRNYLGLQRTLMRNTSSSSIHSSHSWDLELETNTQLLGIKNWKSHSALDNSMNRYNFYQYLSNLDNSIDSIKPNQPKRFLSVQNLQLESFTPVTYSSYHDILNLDNAIDDPNNISGNIEEKNNQELIDFGKSDSTRLTSSNSINRESETISENNCSSLKAETLWNCGNILDMTTATKLKLENYEIYYNPHQMQDILDQWISCLHHITFSFLNSKGFFNEDSWEKSQSDLSTKIISYNHDEHFPKNFFTNDKIFELHKYFKMHYSSQPDIIELITLCFESGIYRLSSFFNLFQNDHFSQGKSVNNFSAREESCVKNSRKSSSVCLFLSLPQSNIQSDSSIARNSLSYNYEPLLTHLTIPFDHISKFLLGENIESDLEAAVFIKLYFALLDVERTKNAIFSQDGDKYQSWSALMDCIIDYQYEFLPIFHIYREVKEYPENIVELLKKHSDISPLDSLYIIRRFGQFPDTLVHFAYAILEDAYDFNKSKNADYFRKFFEDKEVIIPVIEALMESNLLSNVMCDCGLPRPGSHLFEWKHENLLKNILNQNNIPKETLKRTFEKVGYWSGFIFLTKETWCERALKYLVQLGDVILLSEYLNGLADISERNWMTLLNLKTMQEPECDSKSHHILCVDCGTLLLSSLDPLPLFPDKNQLANGIPAFSLTWESLGNLLIKYYGPSQAANLLQSCDIPDNAVSENFFCKLFQVGLIQEQQRLVAHEMLEVFDAYLWSKRSPHFPHQINSLIEDEKQHLLKREPDSWIALFQKLKSQLQRDSLKTTGTHWGLNISLNSICSFCLIPLNSSFNPSDSGLLIFKCGHAFHFCCLLEKMCIQCSSSSS